MRRPYPTIESEEKIQQYWKKEEIHRSQINLKKPKRYILDMFPFPSGYNLHVGHLLGYFASDTYTIFSRLKGYNTLHPMGFDAFGLPAEQHALETGTHPALTTEKNILAYKKVLGRAGLTFDWSRTLSTTEPSYYRWTQWIFLQFFNSWYDHEKDKASPIATLIEKIEKEGNKGIPVMGEAPPDVSAKDWQQMDVHAKEKVLAYYRLTYLAETEVNWCPALGTVLANDEVKDGFSERGGHPVEKKKMKQWSLRILPYIERLLEGLNSLAWPDSVKEMQRHWMGKSEGAVLTFALENEKETLEVFTTRPDTLYGVTYLALAPEHPLVDKLLEALRQKDSALYTTTQIAVQEARNRSERKRIEEVGESRGLFLHHYALHPLTKKRLPIWIAEYVLPSYGKGAIMGVPAHDERDHAFAQHFNLPSIKVVDCAQESPAVDEQEEIVNSEALNGLAPKVARKKIIAHLEKENIGKAQIAYKLRNPVFSRQRYWGEPIPIYYKEGTPFPLAKEELPLILPQVESYQPNAQGDPPLSRALEWTNAQGDPLEVHTMPAWAGSSWYFLRYISPNNQETFVDPKALAYWKEVDLYIGGAEHTTGHLIYARFFTKVLYDLGHLPFQEPFKKLINQGMLQGVSAFVYRIKGSNQFVSYGLRQHYDTVPMHVDIRFVKKRQLDLEAFKKWRKDLESASFILEDGRYICGHEVEKMSKSKHNTVDPQTIFTTYGADVLRLHLLFLGPITQSKPWNTQGIEGIVRFIKKVKALFYDEEGTWKVIEGEATDQAQQALHQAIKQIEENIQRCAFNTSISTLMVLVNAFTRLKVHQEAILKSLLSLLAPFAPHLAEYLWQAMGQKQSIFFSTFPLFDPKYLVTDSVIYPVAINGKTRAKLSLGVNVSQEEAIAAAKALPAIQKRVAEGRLKRAIFIPKKMINFVLSS